MLKSNGLRHSKSPPVKFSFSLKIVPATIAKKLPPQRCFKPLFIPIFNFSRKRPTFAFTSESGYTLGSRRKIAHSGSHGETGGISDGGGITTLGSFRTFTNIPGPGVRTAYFATLGSWPGVLSKNAESLRDSDALMRVAVPGRRGPAGLRDLFRFCRNCGLYALFQILLSVLQTLQLVPFLCKLRLSSFLFGSEFNGFRSKQAGFFAIILENV